MSQNAIYLIEAKSFNTAGLNALTWQAINAPGIEQACFLVRFINLSNVPVQISLDGNTLNDVIPATSMVQTPSLVDSKLFKKGTVIYVRGTAGVGLIYLAGYYVKQ